MGMGTHKSQQLIINTLSPDPKAKSKACPRGIICGPYVTLGPTYVELCIVEFVIVHVIFLQCHSKSEDNPIPFRLLEMMMMMMMIRG